MHRSSRYPIMNRVVGVLIIFAVIFGGRVLADQTIDAEGQASVESMFKEEAPYIAKGRATYPEAKKRYLAGLPRGCSFVVRKHLTDAGTHHTEGVYIDVDGIKNGKILWTDQQCQDLRSFHQGQRISFSESEVEDWAIFHPDGSEEGNFVAKFLKKAQSAYSNGLALSSDDIAKIKRICDKFIGVPFRTLPF